MAIDPTRYRVETTARGTRSPRKAILGIIAGRIRCAPWLVVSVAVHAGAIFALLTIPRADEPASEEVQTPALVVDATPAGSGQREPAPADAGGRDPIVEDPVLQDTELLMAPGTIDRSLAPRAAPVTAPPFDTAAWNLAVGVGSQPGGACEQRPGGRRGLSARHNEATARAIESALEWLKQHQDEDGKWDADEFMKHDVAGEPSDGPGSPLHDVGLTGLALLAFLGDGSTMGSGPYRDVIRSGVKWLRRQQDPATGLFGTNSSNEFIYDHAIATYAMVEAFGLSDSKLLRKIAQDGIDYLEWHRNPYAVWRYRPRDNDNDTSITGWCVMAYRSARDFKLEVNEKAMQSAASWFDRMTDPATGRCGYTERGGLSSRKPDEHASSFPREKGECMTAVSLLCRFFLGQDPAREKVMAAQADLILGKPPVWDADDGSIDHYYWYYASYALYQMGDQHWSTWSRSLTDAVVKSQREDGNFKGSWDPLGVWSRDGGRVYSTAILCLTLEAHYRYTRLVR